MPLKFNYKAKDATGQTRSGVVEAADSKQAVRVLQENKLLVVSLNEKKDIKFLNFLGPKGASERETAQFTRLLSTMLATGLPLTAALSDLSVQTSSDSLKSAIKSVITDVQGGATLSLSMSRFPGIFSPLYISLVKAGEVSGKLDDSLGKLADNLESQLDFKAKIKGALLYPAIIIVAMTGIGILMVTTVIPKIAEVYKEFNSDLPLPTRVLLGVSDFLTNYTIIAILLFAVGFYLYKTLRKNPVSDYVINNLLLKVPVFGPLNSDAQLATMNRTLGTLINAGVGIMDSLKVTIGALDNNYYRKGLETTVSNIQKGYSLSASLKTFEDFPIMESQLVAIGEETGTLDQSLMRLASFYQDSAERKVKTLTTSLEPALILIMGVAVGGMAIAVLLPMFNLVNVIK